MSGELVRKLVIAYRTWDRNPQSRDAVVELNRVLDAIVEDTDVTQNQVFDQITMQRRAGYGVEAAVVGTIDDWGLDRESD